MSHYCLLLLHPYRLITLCLFFFFKDGLSETILAGEGLLGFSQSLNSWCGVLKNTADSITERRFYSVNGKWTQFQRQNNMYLNLKKKKQVLTKAFSEKASSCWRESISNWIKWQHRKVEKVLNTNKTTASWICTSCLCCFSIWITKGIM